MPREFHDLRSRRFDGSGNILVIQYLELESALRNVPVIYEISLATVAKEPLPLAGVVNDILRESLADDKTDQRFASVIDGLVSRAGASKTDKVAGGDFVGLVS